MNKTVKQTLSELGNNRAKLVNRIEQIIDEDEKKIVMKEDLIFLKGKKMNIAKTIGRLPLKVVLMSDIVK